MSGTHEVDPEIRADAIQNIKNDTARIADQLETWSKGRGNPLDWGIPPKHIAMGIEATLNDLLEPILIVVGDGEGYEQILPTFRQLQTEWDDTYRIIYSEETMLPAKEHQLKECADKALSFAKMVQGL